MASNFYVETSQSVGTSFTPVGGYVVGSNTQTTVIGLTIANSLSGNYNSTTTQIFVDAVVNVP